MDKILRELEEEEGANKIQKPKNLLELRNQTEFIANIKVEVTGDVYNNVNDIFDNLISYNSENMRKDISDEEEVRTIQKLKEDAIKSMFMERCECPQTILGEVYCQSVQKVMTMKKTNFPQLS